MAYFGQSAAQPFVTVGQIHQDITATASILIQMAHAEEFETPYGADVQNLRNTIGWGSRERPDEIDQKIEQAILDMETTSRPVLMAHSTEPTWNAAASSLFNNTRWMRRP